MAVRFKYCKQGETRNLNKRTLKRQRPSSGSPEERLQGFADAANDWFWETDAERRLCFLSKRFETDTGLSCATALGLSWSDLLTSHAADAEDIARLEQHLYEQRPFSELKVRWKHEDGDQRVLSFSGYPLHTEKDDYIGHRGVGHDASKFSLWQQTLEESVKSRTAELAASNRRLRLEMEQRELAQAETRAFVESAPDALLLVDKEGIIRLANTQAETLFGYDHATLIEKSIECLVPPRFSGIHATHRHSFYAAPSPRPMGLGREFSGLKRDGSEFPVEISLSPIPSPRGTLIAAAIRDVSERRKAEQRLRDAVLAAEQANRTKSRFLAAASHDLRQPLQTISIYIDVLSHRLSTHDKREILEPMRESMTGMTSMLNGFLDISKLEQGVVVPEVEDFELNTLLERVYASAAAQARAKGLRPRLRPTRAIVRSDPNLLGRIIENFVFNAIRYTEHGQVLLGCRRRGTGLLVQVWDTGIGISSNDTEKIFEDFVQLDNDARQRGKGLGLGLGIAKRLATLLDHELHVASEHGKGSVFSVLVPIAVHSSKVDASAAPTRQSTLPNGTRVMLVEDDTSIALALKALLGISGYGVVHFSNASDALLEMEKNANPFDVIVSDFRLPGDKNGIELICAAREIARYAIPAVIITGDTSPRHLAATEEMGCQVLHKPITSDELLPAIERSLRKLS